MSELRPPPADIAAERHTIGAMLRDPSCIAVVVGILRDTHFGVDALAKAFGAVVALWNDGKPVDLVTVASLLKQRGQEKDCGPALLYELWDKAPTGANVAYYADLVLDKAISRAVLHLGTEMQRDASDGLMPSAELLDKAERSVLDIAQMGIEDQSRDIGDVLNEVCDRIDQRARPGGQLDVQTGFIDLDRYLCGLQAGETTIIAARTSVGKTSLAIGMVHHVAVRLGLPVLFVSLEQSRVEIGERLSCLHTGIDSHTLKSGNLTPDDVAALAQAMHEIRAAPLRIDDTPGQSALRIGASARRFKARRGLRLLVVDYVQLVEPESRRDPRQEQVAGVSRRLKNLAKELGIPIVALAQLNRGPVEGKGRRPQLSDLRESDAVAHDADVVLLLSMDPGLDDAYLRDKLLWEVECKVAKHRNGPTGAATLLFRRSCMRFENLAVGPPADPFVRNEGT